VRDIIRAHVDKQVKERDATAAMVTGSYVTGRMAPNSDIDLFLTWSREYETMRGREYYRGVEFEYFYSPEWKYYDRMRTDPVSARIYSQAEIILDPDGRLARIQAVACPG